MEFENMCNDFHLSVLSYKNSENLPDELKKSMNKIALKQGYESYKIINRTVSTDGGNFLAILYEVEIVGNLNGETKKTNIFIKRAICEKNVEVLDVSRAYSKELLFYGEVNKLFEELENEASVPQDDRFKCVNFYNESRNEAIILQNLTKEGYGTLHRFNVLPLKFAKLSVQKLATLHALSFALEQKRFDYYERKIKTLKISLVLGENFDNYCKKIYETSVAGLDSKWKIIIKENFFKYLEHYKKYITSDGSKIRCLCHGDYRMNNILMKSSNGTIDEVIPIDFQMLHYGSPITDFIYFIFSSTDKKFRDNHLEPLKDLYFKTLNRMLHYFAIDIRNVYPRDQFEIDYGDCLKYGLYIMLFTMPFSFTIEGDVPDFNKKSISDMTVKLDKIYYERLMGIIDNMTEYGKL